MGIQRGSHHSAVFTYGLLGIIASLLMYMYLVHGHLYGLSLHAICRYHHSARHDPLLELCSYGRTGSQPYGQGAS